MKKNYWKLLIITGVIAAAALFASCSSGGIAGVSDGDIEGLKDYIISTFYMEKPGDAAAPRATIPVHTIGPIGFADGTVTFDYPEKGQVTSYAVLLIQPNMYRITATTGYPLNDAITDTKEVYYVQDAATIGEWTNADPVVNTAGLPDNTYRLTFRTTYADKTVRTYNIDTDTSANNWTGVKYAPFDINGAMDFPAAFTPAADTAALYSSATTYVQNVNNKFSMWGRKYIAIVGTQYYTEHGDAAAPTKTFVAYERVIDAGEVVTGNSITKLKNYLYGTPDIDLNAVTLATTVIRYQIDPAGTKTLKQRTVIFSDTGDDFVFESSDGTEPVLAPYIAQ